MGKLCGFHGSVLSALLLKAPQDVPRVPGWHSRGLHVYHFLSCPEKSTEDWQGILAELWTAWKGVQGTGDGTHPGSSRRVSSWPDGWTSSLEPGYKSLHAGKSCCTNFCVPGPWEHRPQPANQDRENIITNWCRLPANEAPFHTQWASGPDNGPRLQGQSRGVGEAKIAPPYTKDQQPGRRCG